MPRLYEIFTTGSAPEQILTDISRTVAEAVRVKLIGTNFVSMRLGPGDIPGSSLNIVHQTKNSLAVGLVGEGAEIPISTEDTYPFQVSVRKYAVRPLITREMQEDSLFAVMERNLREAGYQMARKLDRLILGAARQGAGTTVTGGAAITVANLASMINTLEVNDYALSDFAFAPDVAMDIRNIDTFVEANKAGVNNPSQSLIGTIFGGRVWVCNNIVSTPDSTAAASRTDALALDRDQALLLAEKRPLTVERYSDITRQLDGIVLSARWTTAAIPDTDQGLTGTFTTQAVQLTTTT